MYNKLEEVIDSCGGQITISYTFSACKKAIDLLVGGQIYDYG